MRRGWGRHVAVVGALGLLACGRSGLDDTVGAGPPAGRAGDPTPPSGVPACVPADPPAEVSVPNTPPGLCGGQVAVAGQTPLGPFVASEVRASVKADACGQFTGTAVLF